MWLLSNTMLSYFQVQFYSLVIDGFSPLLIYSKSLLCFIFHWHWLFFFKKTFCPFPFLCFRRGLFSSLHFCICCFVVLVFSLNILTCVFIFKSLNLIDICILKSGKSVWYLNAKWHSWRVLLINDSHVQLFLICFKMDIYYYIILFVVHV